MPTPLHAMSLPFHLGAASMQWRACVVVLLALAILPTKFEAFEYDGFHGIGEWPDERLDYGDVDVTQEQALATTSGPFQLIRLDPAKANANGAVCLDGSPPGYLYRPGTGTGATKWIFYLQGGGWCFGPSDCKARRDSPLGSSKPWRIARLNTQYNSGFLSNNARYSPVFYNWNVVYVMYCDGASFAGNVTAPYKYPDGSLMYMRGEAIFRTVLQTVIDRGMAAASQVLVVGYSAGGLGTYFHCDRVAGYMSQHNVPVKCMTDAGYFIDINNTAGVPAVRYDLKNLMKFHNITASALDSDCANAMGTLNLWRCMFPQYAVPYIKTPIFTIQTEYDTYQLSKFFLAPTQSTQYNDCLLTRNSGIMCTAAQIATIQKYRLLVVAAAQNLLVDKANGAFYISCFAHAVTQNNGVWNGGWKLGGANMATVFVAWYFGGSVLNTQRVDCAYPCNSACKPPSPPSPRHPPPPPRRPPPPPRRSPPPQKAPPPHPPPRKPPPPPPKAPPPPLTARKARSVMDSA